MPEGGKGETSPRKGDPEGGTAETSLKSSNNKELSKGSRGRQDSQREAGREVPRRKWCQSEARARRAREKETPKGERQRLALKVVTRLGYQKEQQRRGLSKKTKKPSWSLVADSQQLGTVWACQTRASIGLGSRRSVLQSVAHLQQ